MARPKSNLTIFKEEIKSLVNNNKLSKEDSKKLLSIIEAYKYEMWSHAQNEWSKGAREGFYPR